MKNQENTGNNRENDAQISTENARQILQRENDAKKVALGARIEVAIDLVGGPGLAAHACGVSVSTLRRYARGEVAAPFVAMVGLARASGVSLEWLATGQGPIERAPDQAHGTTGPAPAHRPARPARREAAPRTGLYEPDEDPAYQRWPVDVGVFHAIVNAADSVSADMYRGDRTEISRWMYLAIDIMTRAPDNRRRLDDADMQALARIVRKLVFTEENGE